MHFLLAYDIQSLNNATIESEVQIALAPYSWVKALSSGFVINVPGPTEWSEIKQRLQIVAGQYPGQFYFLMAPLSQGGAYDGWLNPNVWAEVNARSI